MRTQRLILPNKEIITFRPGRGEQADQIWQEWAKPRRERRLETGQLSLDFSGDPGEPYQRAESSALEPQEDISYYLVGSRFLTWCSKLLLRSADEGLVFVSGLQLEPILTLDQLVGFGLKRQSLTGAEADRGSALRALIQLDCFGHKLHGVFHSHPGDGPIGTLPSGIDHETQARLERGGYPVIGGIFSRDGYVRFFSEKNQFEVITYGTGIESAGEKVFRVCKDSNLQDQAARS